ncbi:MAG: DUF924 family protein [Hyphomonadaceae bacterium]
MTPTPNDVLTFWRDAGPKAWFAKSDAFDATIRNQFESLHHAAARGELTAWEETADGALALLLLLDQFPRNMYRDSAHAFATDPLARGIASRAIAKRFDQAFENDLRAFFYLPFEHSEDTSDQARAIALFESTGDADLVKWAKLHADIITRFGRFPHRNASLGRETTEAEKEFLAGGGFKG